MLSATFFVGKLLQPYIQLKDSPLAHQPDSPTKVSQPQVKPVIQPVTQATVQKPVQAKPPQPQVTQVKQQSQTQAQPPTQSQPQPATPTVPQQIAPVKVSKTVAAKVAASPKMTEQWAQEQVTKYQFDFDEADKDKSGNLSYAEVKEVLVKGGFKGSEEESKKIFAGLDMTKDGKVTLVEYMAAIKKIPKSVMKEMALRRAFQILDKDKSGSLTRKEVIAATEGGAKLNVSSEKIADLLQALVTDDDQKLDYEEFLAVFGIKLTGEIMKSTFRLIDKDGSGFLTKDELIDAIRADEDLSIRADKISALLIAWIKDDDKKLNYDEFVKVWNQQKPVKK